VRLKTIQEEPKIFLPYLSFRPSDLLSSRVGNVDLPEIVVVGGGGGSMKICRPGNFY